MRSTPRKPWPWLIMLLLISSGLGWHLASRDGYQHWLVFIGMWAGASAGILAMPFFKPLAKFIPRDTVANIVLLGIVLILTLVISSILVDVLRVGEVIEFTFFAFLFATLVGVGFEAELLKLKEKRLRVETEDQLKDWSRQQTVCFIFSLTVYFTVRALDVEESASGIVGFLIEPAICIALLFATAPVSAWIFASVRPASNYRVFQTFQILALIFGVGLGLGWVTRLLT